MGTDAIKGNSNAGSSWQDGGEETLSSCRSQGKPWYLGVLRSVPAGELGLEDISAATGRFYQLGRVLPCRRAASGPWGRQGRRGVAGREAEPQHPSDCLSVKQRDFGNSSCVEEHNEH